MINREIPPKNSTATCNKNKNIFPKLRNGEVRITSDRLLHKINLPSVTGPRYQPMPCCGCHAANIGLNTHAHSHSHASQRYYSARRGWLWLLLAFSSSRCLPFTVLLALDFALYYFCTPLPTLRTNRAFGIEYIIEQNSTVY